jgi:hypothetical protein
MLAVETYEDGEHEVVCAFGNMRIAHREELGSLIISIALGDRELPVELEHVLLAVHNLLCIGALASTDLWATRLRLLRQHVLNFEKIIVVASLLNETTSVSRLNSRNVASSLQPSYLGARQSSFQMSSDITYRECLVGCIVRF